MFLSPSCKNPPYFQKNIAFLIVPVSINPMLQISPQHLFQLVAEKILLETSKSRTDTLVALTTHAVHKQLIMSWVCASTCKINTSKQKEDTIEGHHT